MPTVSEIAKLSFNAVSGAIPDAIQVATLTDTTQGAYDVVSGSYSTSDATYQGRAVIDTVKPPQDIFPDYVAGPHDNLVLLEGFTVIPDENWVLTIKGEARKIKRVQDILKAGSLFYVVAI